MSSMVVEVERKRALAHAHSRFICGSEREGEFSLSLSPFLFCDLLACAAEAPRDFSVLSFAQSLTMTWLDAARTFTNARATTSGGGSAGTSGVAAIARHHAPQAASRFHHRRRLRVVLPPLCAVPPNGSSSISSNSGVSDASPSGNATTRDASSAAAAIAAAATGAIPKDSSLAVTTATTTAPVLQRDSAFPSFAGSPQVPGAIVLLAFLSGLVGRVSGARTANVVGHEKKSMVFPFFAHLSFFPLDLATSLFK